MLVPNWTRLDCTVAGASPDIVPRWRGLAGRSLAPAGHHAPEVLGQAFARWNQGLLATVEDDGDLRLALPLVRRRLPLPVLENWSSPVNFHALPHIDRACAEPAAAAFFRAAGVPLLLRAVPTQGPVWEALSASAARVQVLRRWQRAVLRPHGSYAHWFESNFDRRRRSALRRLRARLSEQGAFEAESFVSGSDAGLWADQFLGLEARGWKGRRRTAMMADARTASAFRAACIALAAAGQLRFWKFSLDGSPVAMLFAYADGNEIWLGKIAYDEAFAKFSPGVSLLLHATERIFAEGFVQADSCAAPGHPMIDNLWRQRIDVGDVLLAGPAVSATMFRCTVAAEAVRHRIGQAARKVLNRGRAPAGS